MLRNSSVASCSSIRSVEAKAGPRGLVLVAAKGGGNQKNRGLYFEYEAVDPAAHKELPMEKEKVQEEFSWVRRARGLPPAKPKKPFVKKAAANKQRAPQKPPPSGTSGSATATQSAAHGAAAVAAAATAAVAAAAVAAAATAAMAAAAVKQESPAAQSPASDTSSRSAPVQPAGPTHAAAQAAASTSEPAPTHLLDVEMPPVLDANNAEEQQVRGLLAGLLQLDPEEVEQLKGELDWNQLSMQTSSGQADFSAWLQQVRGAQSGSLDLNDDSQLAVPGLQTSSGSQPAAAARLQRLASSTAPKDDSEQDADRVENDVLLADAAAAEAGVSALLSGAGRELQEFKTLLGQLQGAQQLHAEGQELEQMPPVISEEQMLAELAKTDPELHKLLTADVGLDDSDEATRELELAMASLAGWDGESADDESQREPAAAQLPRELNKMLGEDDEEGDQKQLNDNEEEVTDAELEALAASDPDLAALLRSNTLGKNFEKLVGEDEDEDELDEGVGFSDLFDAIDEDPDLDDADRERAKMELQSMFNMAGRSSPSGPAQPVTVTRGPTTTGTTDAPAAAPPPLLPKPSPRK